MRNIDNPIKTNKLVINLIKDTATCLSDVYDTTDAAIQSVSLDGVGVLAFKRSIPRPADWIAKFFPNTTEIDPSQFQVASSQALLVVEVENKGIKRFMTVAFGSGRFLIKDDVIEERFGLLSTLNVLPAEGIRGLGKKNISLNPKMSKEQISKPTSVGDFEFDFESDLIQSLTGGSDDPAIGKTVSGKDSFTISNRVDMSNVKSYLAHCLETYLKSDYKSKFPWIDHIKEVRDGSVTAPLAEKLLTMVAERSDSVLLSIPEIIDWDSFGGFKYSKRKGDELKSELDMEEMLEAIGFDAAPSMETLKKNPITIWNLDGTSYTHSWPVFSCITAEVELNAKTFILTGGKWFEVQQDYMLMLEAAISDIPQSSIAYIPYAHKTENDYCKELAERISGGCMDQNCVNHGAGNSKIEFCDVITRNKELIHAKIYRGSSGLSHLFKQGMVAAELFLHNKEFRKKIRRKMVNEIEKPQLLDFREDIPLERPKPGEYAIVFAVIQKGTGPVKLPLFSKIALRGTVERLMGYGYRVFLDKIPKTT